MHGDTTVSASGGADDSRDTSEIASLIQILTAQSESQDRFAEEISRAKAADALGRLGDASAVPALIAALNDPNYVSVCAARALARIRHPGAIEPLVAVLEDENKFWVPRGAAAVALGELGEIARPALAALQRALQYDVSGTGEAWDMRAREAVEDALTHITDSTAPCSLKGQGYRFEMRGIY